MKNNHFAENQQFIPFGIIANPLPSPALLSFKKPEMREPAISDFKEIEQQVACYQECLEWAETRRGKEGAQAFLKMALEVAGKHVISIVDLRVAVKQHLLDADPQLASFYKQWLDEQPLLKGVPGLTFDIATCHKDAIGTAYWLFFQDFMSEQDIFFSAKDWFTAVIADIEDPFCMNALCHFLANMVYQNRQNGCQGLAEELLSLYEEYYSVLTNTLPKELHLCVNAAKAA